MIPQPHLIENAGCAVPAAPESPRISASVPRDSRELGHVPVPYREVLANWATSRFGQPPCSKTRACPSIVLSGARESGHVPVEKGNLLANRVMSPLKRARKLGHGRILGQGGRPTWDMARFLSRVVSGAVGQSGTCGNLRRNPHGRVARHEKGRQARSPTASTFWWRRWGSNPRPQACKARALPAELRPRA